MIDEEEEREIWNEIHRAPARLPRYGKQSDMNGRVTPKWSLEQMDRDLSRDGRSLEHEEGS